MEVDYVIDLVQRLGFPIALTCALLYMVFVTLHRLDTTVGALTTAVNEMRSVLATLVTMLGIGGRKNVGDGN